MAEGRNRAQWGHTSALLTMIAGLFDPKAHPDQFNPYAQQDRLLAAPLDQKAGFAALKTLVLSGGLNGARR
jgi:hypothetical protein